MWSGPDARKKTKDPGSPIKNVGDDREGKTGMTEEDIGKCQRRSEHIHASVIIQNIALSLPKVHSNDKVWQNWALGEKIPGHVLR